MENRTFGTIWDPEDPRSDGNLEALEKQDDDEKESLRYDDPVAPHQFTKAYPDDVEPEAFETIEDGLQGAIQDLAVDPAGDHEERIAANEQHEFDLMMGNKRKAKTFPYVDEYGSMIKRDEKLRRKK